MEDSTKAISLEAHILASMGCKITKGLICKAMAAR